MERKKRTVLALGILAVVVMLAFAAIPLNSIACGDPSIKKPTVVKCAAPTEVTFGSVTEKSEVTIKVTGAGGTSTTITPMDVVFAIDSSGSMRYWSSYLNKWLGNDVDGLRRDAAKYFVDQMDDSRDTGGVVSWDNDIDFEEGLMDDFSATSPGLKYHIDQVDDSGGTNLNVGLNAAIDMLDDNSRTETSSEVIIFLTDGSGTYTTAANGGPASEAATKGYVIYSIGLNMVSGGLPESRLKDMATATGGAYYSSPSASNLQDVYDDIYSAIVTSTQPHDVEVIEVTSKYITGHCCYDPTPDSVTSNADGTTTIVWKNVGQYAGDGDNVLSADETAVLKFKVTANKPGYKIPVQEYGDAIVKYYNADGGYAGTVLIPQAHLTAKQAVNIIADGGSAATAIDVGDVIVWQDASYLYVKYVTSDGWKMTESHLAVGDDLTDIPQTKKGNPIPGKFPYKTTHSPWVTEYTYKIPWTWAKDAKLYIAAHCVVKKQTGTDAECTPIYREETGWGEGDDFDGNNWGMYFTYEDP
jgi:Ca-activated chloride channel family protein